MIRVFNGPMRAQGYAMSKTTTATRTVPVEAPPKLAVGDGALGFGAALREVFPTTGEQRCWVHKTANVLNKLPKSVQPKAKVELHEIWQAETRDEAHGAFDHFWCDSFRTSNACSWSTFSRFYKHPRRCAAQRIDILRYHSPCRTREVQRDADGFTGTARQRRLFRRLHSR